MESRNKDFLFSSRGKMLVFLAKDTNSVFVENVENVMSTPSLSSDLEEDLLTPLFLEMQLITNCYYEYISTDYLFRLQEHFLDRKELVRKVINDILIQVFDYVGNISTPDPAVDEIVSMDPLGYDKTMDVTHTDLNISNDFSIVLDISYLSGNFSSFSDTLLLESTKNFSENNSAVIYDEISYLNSGNVDGQNCINGESLNMVAFSEFNNIQAKNNMETPVLVGNIICQGGVDELMDVPIMDELVELNIRDKDVEQLEEETNNEENIYQHELNNRTSIITEESDKENEMFEIDRSNTKIGNERKRKKYVKSKLERTEYTAMKRRKCHPVKKPGCNCKKNCSQYFTYEIRESINTKFWKMDFKEKKKFLSNNVQLTSVTRRRKELKNEEEYRKNVSRSFSLKNNDGKRVTVCKTFFLGTLGYSANNDFIVRKIISPPIDRRGSYQRKKSDKEEIKNHINMYSPCASHYRREHAPNKLYLPSDITITDMYNDYKSKYPHRQISYEVYRKVVTVDMKISFTKLGHEECEKCESFQLHDKEHKKDNLELFPNCNTCVAWKIHIEKAKISRDEYKTDVVNSESNPETAYFSVDMQKVIMLPRLDMFKQIIFTPRIIVFNESFVPLGKFSNKYMPFAVLWHEGISGRKKEDIVSAFHNFLTNRVARDYKHIVLWADNCSGQNKNWCFFSFLLYFINSNETAAESITVKYLEAGHTYMSADSFHHLVEQSFRKHPKCYDFQDFVDVVRNSSRKGIEIKEMCYSDFRHWPNLVTNYQLQKLNRDRPLLKNVCSITVKRGHYDLFYKEKFTEEEKKLNVLGKKNKNLKQPNANEKPRGISQTRKDTLIKNLSGICPEHKLIFWKELAVNDNAVNLIQEFEDE